jgi:hypothetical protein
MPVTNPPRATRATRASSARQAAVARVEGKLAQGARTNPLTASGRGASGAHRIEGAARRRDRDHKRRSVEADTNTAILEQQLAYGLRVANAPKGKDKRKPGNTATALGDGHGSPMRPHSYARFYDAANKFSPLGEETWPGASPEYASEVQPSASPSPVRSYPGYEGFTMGDGIPIPFATKPEDLDAFDNARAVPQSEWDAQAQYGSMGRVGADSAVFTGLSGYTIKDGIFNSDPPSPVKPSDVKKSVHFNPTLDQTAYFCKDDAPNVRSFPPDEQREFNQPATPLLPAVSTAGGKQSTQPKDPTQRYEDLGLRGPNDVQSLWPTKDISDYLDAHMTGEVMDWSEA